MIRVAIADDNPFLIQAAREKLSFFDEAAIRIIAVNGQDLIDQLAVNHNIDVILMDIEMPGINGIEATSHIKQKHPQIRIIMLTVFDNDENIFNAIKAGADGYLLKEVTAAELWQGIRDTLSGGATMTPSIAMKALKLLRNPIAVEGNSRDQIQLTMREIDVLEQLSKGLTSQKIATNLYVSAGTVRKHVENIYAKLQVHNKLEAVEKARLNKLI